MLRDFIIEYLCMPKKHLNPAWRNMLSKDLKDLSLSNFNFDQFCTIDSVSLKKDPYNQLFDILDLYDTIETLSIHSNYLDSLPDTVKKFTNLKSVDLSGMKWWDLHSNQLPSCVEEFVVECKDLPKNFLATLQTDLPNLRILGFDMTTRSTSCIPYIESLEEVYLYTPDFGHIDTLLKNYKNISYSAKDDVYVTVVKVKSDT